MLLELVAAKAPNLYGRVGCENGLGENAKKLPGVITPLPGVIAPCGETFFPCGSDISKTKNIFQEHHLLQKLFSAERVFQPF
jgi:hypothetical protein